MATKSKSTTKSKPKTMSTNKPAGNEKEETKSKEAIPEIEKVAAPEIKKVQKTDDEDEDAPVKNGKPWSEVSEKLEKGKVRRASWNDQHLEQENDVVYLVIGKDRKDIYDFPADDLSATDWVTK